MPDAVHVASGKVREIYALDDERLLLAASDRISTFDVVLPTPIPDKGRVLTGLSAFWFAGRASSYPTTCSRCGRTGGRWSAGASTCSRSSASSAATSPGPAGRTTGSRDRSAATSSRRAFVSRSGSPSRSSRLRRRRARDTTRTSTRSRRRSSAGRTAIARRRRPRSCSIASRRRTRRRAGSSSPTRSSSSGPPRRDARARRRGAHSRLVTVLAGRGYEPGRAQPSFDKQFVRDWCEGTGWDKTPPGPELPDDVVSGTRARYVEAFELLTAIPFDRYVDDPGVVLA